MFSFHKFGAEPARAKRFRVATRSLPTQRHSSTPRRRTKIRRCPELTGAARRTVTDAVPSRLSMFDIDALDGRSWGGGVAGEIGARAEQELEVVADQVAVVVVIDTAFTPWMAAQMA